MFFIRQFYARRFLRLFPIYYLVVFIAGDFSASLVFAWLVSSTGLGFKGQVGKFLELPPLSYLGKITYGIYVYHYFAPLVPGSILAKFGYQLQVPGFKNFILSSILTIIVASLS